MALALCIGCDTGAPNDGGVPGRDAGVFVGDAGAPSPAPRLAGEIVAAPGASEGPFGDPTLAVNGVRGGGDGAGSLDVFSLDFGDGASLTLGFGGARFVDGPGEDLAVFENGFVLGGGPAVFMEQAVVSVSPDGEAWVDLPHDYTAPDETVYSAEPGDWPGFAGRTPVRLHAEDNPVDPFDREAAGGDGFDLEALADVDDPVAERVLLEGARYVRLSSAPTRINPDTGEPYPRDVTSGGADIDGVFARWFVP